MRIVPFLALPLVAGCAVGGSARNLFAAEFACPSRRVTAHRIGGSQYRVRGCGREALYACAEGTCMQTRPQHASAGTLRGAGDWGADALRESRDTRVRRGVVDSEPALRFELHRELHVLIDYHAALGGDQVLVDVEPPVGSPLRSCDELEIRDGEGSALAAVPTGRGRVLALPIARLVSLSREGIEMVACDTVVRLRDIDAQTLGRFVVEARELAAAAVPARPTQAVATRDGPPTASAPTASVAAASDTEAEAGVRAWLDAHAAEIQGCAGQARVFVRVEWDRERSSLALQPPLAGSAEERCVQALLGTSVPALEGHGRVIHATGR